VANQVLVIIIVGVISLIGLVAVRHSVRRKASRTVAGRKPFNDDQFAALFPVAAEAHVASTIRSALAPYVKVPVEVIHPDDLLVADLCLGDAAIDEPESFLEQVVRDTGVEIPPEVAIKARTLRDIIQYVAPRVQRAN